MESGSWIAVHAAVDGDTLGIAHLPDGAPDDLMLRNLASVWNNYAEAGVTRLLLAEAVESRAELDRIRRAIPGAEILVCRLRADMATMQRRVSLRKPGLLQERLVRRVAELEAVTEVARELLRRARWL